jgi:hypothetical protein
VSPSTTPAALQAHARELAAAFNVRLIESAQLKPEEAFGRSDLRAVFCAPITEETTYAVVLHEIGHHASPTGVVRGLVEGDRGNLIRIEEAAAWAWARHYALAWTPVMERVARWAEGTYQQAAAPAAAPQAPVAPKRIDWKEWK